MDFVCLSRVSVSPAFQKLALFFSDLPASRNPYGHDGGATERDVFRACGVHSMLHLRANIQSRSPSELHNVDPFALAPCTVNAIAAQFISQELPSLDTTRTQLSNPCEWFRLPAQARKSLKLCCFFVVFLLLFYCELARFSYALCYVQTRHERVCSKNQKLANKRPVFNTSKKRIEGTDLQSFLASRPYLNTKKPSTAEIVSELTALCTICAASDLWRAVENHMQLFLRILKHSAS